MDFTHKLSLSKLFQVAFAFETYALLNPCATEPPLSSSMSCSGCLLNEKEGAAQKLIAGTALQLDS